MLPRSDDMQSKFVTRAHCRDVRPTRARREEHGMMHTEVVMMMSQIVVRTAKPSSRWRDERQENGDDGMR